MGKKMPNTKWILILLMLLLPSVGMANDLYLLDIKSEDGLKTVKENIGFAHGIIDGKFMVFLDQAQIEALLSADVRMELLVEDCFIEDYYLIIKGHDYSSKTMLSLSPVYSTSFSFLVRLDRGSNEVLARSGFMTFPIAEKRTPFFYRRTLHAAPMLEDYPTDSLADYVSQDSLYNYVTRLEAFYTRATHTDSVLKARDWLVDKFIEFGYTDVTTHEFIAYSGWQGVIDIPAYNVLCRKVGTEQPDTWIVIGGHYDSFTYETVGDPYAPAPGADDDATGVALTLELARIFKDIPTRKSYLFVPFGAEEQYLIGSDSLALKLHEDSVNVEFMLNTDMIAYERDGVPEFHIGANNNLAYYQVFADASQRVSDLIPIRRYGPLWDDLSFAQYGAYTVALFEGEHPHPGVHSTGDNSASLNFGYMTKIVRTAVATMAVIDASIAPVECSIYDVGDGQALRVVLDDCEDIYTYTILYGTESGVYTDTIDIPPPACEYDIDGLTSGQDYYIAVWADDPTGYGSIFLIENIGIPYMIPRAPTGLTADPDYQKILLNWETNSELDLDHYMILRKPSIGDWEVLADYYTDTNYEDQTAEAHIEYEYIILAVDTDMNESDSSAVVSAMAATFDLPLLFIDETLASGGINPTEAQETEFYGNIFAPWPFVEFDINTGGDRLGRSLAGQYKSIIWLDDDVSVQDLSSSLDSLDWFLGYNTDLCIAGWQTIAWAAGESQLSPGDFFYDHTGISSIDENPAFDFVGADGQNGWPNLQVTPDNVFNGMLPYISVFTAVPEAEVIYTYNSVSSDPNYQDKPAGIAYETGSGKRVALSFPVYHLTESSALQLTAKICSYFEIESNNPNGDANLDGIVNIFDITYIIVYLYLGGAPPLVMNLADVNGDCEISIFDFSYLISYLYLSGPAPIDGCVE